VSEAETTPDRPVKVFTKPKTKALTDFAAWGKKKNPGSVAPLAVDPTNPSPATAGATQGSDSEDEADSDDEARKRAREDRVAELFTFAPPTPLAAEADKLKAAMRSLMPTRDLDGSMARALVFARRDRLDKIREVAINVMIAVAALIT
jgi:hypothetical protein